MSREFRSFFILNGTGHSMTHETVFTVDLYKNNDFRYKSKKNIGFNQNDWFTRKEKMQEKTFYSHMIFFFFVIFKSTQIKCMYAFSMRYFVCAENVW